MVGEWDLAISSQGNLEGVTLNLVQDIARCLLGHAKKDGHPPKDNGIWKYKGEESLETVEWRVWKLCQGAFRSGVYTLPVLGA